MKKVVLAALSGAPALALPATALAQYEEMPESRGMYVTVNGGTLGGGEYDNQYPFDESSTTLDGAAATIAFGFQVDHWRFEAGYDYRSQDIETAYPGFEDPDFPEVVIDPYTETGKATAHGSTVNAYYDFAPEARITPYIGAGMGAYYLTIDDNLVDGSGSGFQYQAMAGVAVKVSDSVSITTEARYQTLSYSIEGYGNSDDTERVTMDGAGIRAGLRVKF